MNFVEVFQKYDVLIQIAINTVYKQQAIIINIHGIPIGNTELLAITVNEFLNE